MLIAHNIVNIATYLHRAQDFVIWESSIPLCGPYFQLLDMFCHTYLLLLYFYCYYTSAIAILLLLLYVCYCYTSTVTIHLLLLHFYCYYTSAVTFVISAHLLLFLLKDSIMSCYISYVLEPVFEPFLAHFPQLLEMPDLTDLLLVCR